MAFRNASIPEDFQTAVYEQASNAPPAIRLADCQVEDVSTPTVMATQYRARKLCSVPGDEAETGIAVEKRRDLGLFIRTAQINPGSTGPEVIDLSIHGNRHRFDLNIHVQVWFESTHFLTFGGSYFSNWSRRSEALPSTSTKFRFSGFKNSASTV